MKLRSQMFLASLLTLLVPGVAWHSVRQLDRSLLAERENALALTVANARIALTESPRLAEAVAAIPDLYSAADLYAEPSRYPLFIDGYADDWSNLEQSPRHFDALRLRTAMRDDALFLFIDIDDAEVRYHQPPVLRADAGENEQPEPEQVLVNGDSLEIASGRRGERIDRWLLRALAPGAVDVLRLSDAGAPPWREPVWQSDTRVQASWVEDARGVQIEIRLPMPAADARLALAYVDVDTPNEARTRAYGTTSLAALRRGDGGVVRRESGGAQSVLSDWVPAGVRARLFDRDGYRLADVNRLYEQPGERPETTALGGEPDSPDAGMASLFAELGDALLARLFEYLVARHEQPAAAPYALRLALHLDPATTPEGIQPPRRYVSADNDALLGQLVPIGEDRHAWLLYEDNERFSGDYAGNQLARLLALLTAVSVLVGGGLLLYASLLSLRIRRLSRDADRAVARDGRVLGLSGSRAHDEIGDLSRNLSSLLERSAAYTDYLEALASRLSHELRTPLSVVRTSLENIDRESLDAQSRTLLERADGGSRQLGTLITALVESTRLEQTVQQSSFESIPLDAWMEGARARYAQIHPERRVLLLDSATSDWATPPGARAAQTLGASRWSAYTVQASAELLQQAFDKLVDNAVTFSRDDTLGLLAQCLDAPPQPRVLLGVINRGPALADATIASMFDPMVSHRETRDGGRHLGLGLYIVRMVAEAHGGQVVAENLAGRVLVGMVIPR